LKILHLFLFPFYHSSPPRSFAFLHSSGLLAVTAFTHSYDQNQRYVPLQITQLSENKVVVNIPEFPVIFAGHYQMFLTSTEGIVHPILRSSPPSPHPSTFHLPSSLTTLR
jgi:hypothetical protein